MFVYAACDSVYFLNHAPALVLSAAENQHRISIHIINPTQEAVVMNACLSHLTASYSGWCSEVDLSGYSTYHRRTLYSVWRFLNVKNMLREQGDAALVVDVDSIIRRPVEIDDEVDVGLYLRDPLPNVTGLEEQGTRVAAGAVFIHPRAQIYAERIAKIISSNKLQWFLDQCALYAAYQEFEQKKLLRFFKFDATMLDWAFNDNSAIWTGKGGAKYDAPKYVKLKKHYDTIYHAALKRFLIRKSAELS